VFTSVKSVNNFLSEHPEYGVIGTENIGGKEHIHVALNRNKGVSISGRALKNPASVLSHQDKMAYEYGGMLSTGEYIDPRSTPSWERLRKRNKEDKMFRGAKREITRLRARGNPVGRGRSYKGFSIEKSGDNYRVRDANGSYMSGVAATYGTAKKWIDQHIYAVRNRHIGTMDRSGERMNPAGKYLHIITPYGKEYLVNSKGEITQKGNEFSGQWLFSGIRHTKRTSTFIRFSDLTPERLASIEWQFKNGSPQWTVQDKDHGTTRIWGNYQAHAIKSMWYD
jgi:hypothetical protein